MPGKGIIWVIGGTSGIGEATAKWLSDDGADVVATGPECDVRDISALHLQREQMETGPHYLAGVVYSAGINYLEWIGKTLDSSTAARLRDPIDVNLVGFINTLEVVASRELRDERPLPVVAVSSDAAIRPMRTSISYCASKAGLDMAVKVAARELGPFGWRVNAVSPGMTEDTGIQRYVDSRVPEVRGWSEEQTRAYENSQAVVEGRIDKEQVAEVIAQTLWGPPHLNGSIITLNGGR